MMMGPRSPLQQLFIVAFLLVFAGHASASPQDNLHRNQQTIAEAVADPLAYISSLTWRNRDGGKSFMIDPKNGFLWATFPDRLMKEYSSDEATAMMKDLSISGHTGWRMVDRGAAGVRHSDDDRDRFGELELQEQLATDLDFVADYCSAYPDKAFSLFSSNRYSTYIINANLWHNERARSAIPLPVRPFTFLDRYIADHATLPDIELLAHTASRMLRARTTFSRNLPVKPAEPEPPAMPVLVKGEFETTPQFEERKAAAVKELRQSEEAAQLAYQQELRTYYEKLEDANLLYAHKIAMAASSIEYLVRDAVEDAWHLLFGDPVFDSISYNADAGEFTVTVRSSRRSFLQQLSHKVPLHEAPSFKQDVLNLELVPAVDLSLSEEGLITLAGMSVTTNETLHRDAYSDAARQNTIVAYRTFIDSYPTAAEAEAARQKIADLQAEDERLEQERLARRAAEQQRKADAHRKELAKYQAFKHAGDKVCRDGRVAFFLPVTVTAYVEVVSGNRIQVRIADTQGQSINYNGVDLRQNTIIWDDYDNWKHCQ